MHGIKLLEKLFNKKSYKIQRGGDNETSALIKLVIVVIILFFVYTYFQNKEKDINRIERHMISNNSNSFVSNAISNRDHGTYNIGVERMYTNYNDNYNNNYNDNDNNNNNNNNNNTNNNNNNTLTITIRLTITMIISITLIITTIKK